MNDLRPFRIRLRRLVVVLRRSDPGASRAVPPAASARDTILVDVAQWMNRIVLYLTPQGVLTRVFPPFGFLHVEIWVVGWLLLAGGGFLVLTRAPNSVPVQIVICALVAWRAVEIFAIQSSMFLDLHVTSGGVSQLAVRSLRRSLILAAINYFEIVVQFAGFYVTLFWKGDVTVDSTKNVAWILLHESLVAMVGNSSGMVHPQSKFAWSLAIVQPVAGLFLLSAVVSRLISGFPAPVILDAEEHPDKRSGPGP